MNTVILTGRLTKDPELKRTPTDLAVCQFTLAVDRGYKDNNGNKQTDFINCVAWKGTAENLAKYQGKGSLILIEGQIQTRNYDDKNGVKHYITEVVANRIEFLSPKKEDNNGYQQSNTVNQYNQYQQQQNQQAYANPFTNQAQQQSNQAFFNQQQNNQESNVSPFDFNGLSNDDLPF